MCTFCIGECRTRAQSFVPFFFVLEIHYSGTTNQVKPARSCQFTLEWFAGRTNMSLVRRVFTSRRKNGLIIKLLFLIEPLSGCRVEYWIIYCRCLTTGSVLVNLVMSPVQSQLSLRL